MNVAKLTLAAGCMMLAAASTWAMPTREELVQAQELVKDLTADDVRALKSGAKKPGEVAAAQMALADEAETEAGKYLLLQGAFKLYARSADYDAAANALARMRREIADLPPEVLVELVNGEMRRVAADKAPGVLAIFRDAQRTIKCRKELAAAEATAQAKPSNAAVLRRLAECHAGLGDWTKALEIFAKAGDEAAKYELDPSSAKGYDALKAANYWWDYPAKDDEPFKLHAAMLYKKGLADGSISGLRKTLAEKRVKQMESVLPAEGDGSAANVSASSRGRMPANALYCVIDISAGPTASKYPVKWLATLPPEGFNSDEYRTNKLLLRRIPAGKDPLGRYSISSDFFLGVFMVTTCQWKLVMGETGMTQHGDDKLPIVEISWQDIRGNMSGKDDEGMYYVEPNSFAGKLVQKTGLKGFDLPLAAQWEYACRAGSDKDVENNPNDWGLYNMAGKIWERCLDFRPKLQGKDPVGRIDGTHCDNRKAVTKRAWTNYCNPYSDRGFRLFLSADNDNPSGRADFRGSGTSVASVKAPDANAKRPMKIQLGGGVEIEMLPCPAGTFTMGGSRHGMFRAHTVTISRSFWMSKYPLTYAQARSITGKTCKEMNKQGEPPFPWDALGGDKTPAGASPRQAFELLETMNAKYASRLPRGYVFRFPTEAEWDYARVSGRSGSWNDDKYRKRAIFVEERQKALEEKGLRVNGFEKWPWVLPPVAVGTKAANEWGFHDMLGNGWEYMLDTVKSERDKLFTIDADMLAEMYKDGDIDPASHYEGPNQTFVMRGLGWGEAKFKGQKYKKALFSFADVFHHDGHIRLVIGPDLLKERGIKLPDLGK